MARLTINPRSGGSPAEARGPADDRASDVAIVSERSMYWPGNTPWGEAHNDYRLGEHGPDLGSSRGPRGAAERFHTYILFANPSGEPGERDGDLPSRDGPPVVKDFVVGPSSRLTIGSSDVPGAERPRVRRTDCGDERQADPGRTLDVLECERHLLGRRRERRRRPRAVVAASRRRRQGHLGSRR